MDLSIDAAACICITVMRATARSSALAFTSPLLHVRLLRGSPLATKKPLLPLAGVRKMTREIPTNTRNRFHSKGTSPPGPAAAYLDGSTVRC